MTNTIKNKFNNFKLGSDYIFSIDDNKEMYAIYSEKLKQFLRDIIINKVLSERFRKNIKIEGHSIDGDYFSYEGGVGDLPDRFIANAGWEEKFGRRTEEVEKQEEEARQRDKEIKERIEKEGCPPENHSFHFSRWEGDSLVERKSLFLNYDPFELEGGDNSSKIQEITYKETKKKKNDENSSNSIEKDQAAENHQSNQQNQSQKIDNKDNSSKNIYYGAGLVFLVLFVISMMIVWVKKKK